MYVYVLQIFTRRTAYEDGEAFEVHNFKSLADAVKEQSAVEGQIILCNTTYIHTYIHTYTHCMHYICVYCMYVCMYCMRVLYIRVYCFCMYYVKTA